MCGTSTNGAGLLAASAILSVVCLGANLAAILAPWYTLTNSSGLTTSIYTYQVCLQLTGSGLLPQCILFSSAPSDLRRSLPSGYSAAIIGGTAAIAFLALSSLFSLLLCIAASIQACLRVRGGGATPGCCQACFAGRAATITFGVLACVLAGVGAIAGWASLGSYANAFPLVSAASRAAAPGALVAGLALACTIIATCCATIPFCSAQHGAPAQGRTTPRPSLIVINPGAGYAGKPQYATDRLPMPLQMPMPAIKRWRGPPTDISAAAAAAAAAAALALAGSNRCAGKDL
jgi:hypothetical protein